MKIDEINIGHFYKDDWGNILKATKKLKTIVEFELVEPNDNHLYQYDRDKGNKGKIKYDKAHIQFIHPYSKVFELILDYVGLKPSILRMYYGYFLSNGKRLRIDTLSDEEVLYMLDMGCLYFVPLLVCDPSKFKTNDKFIDKNKIEGNIQVIDYKDLLDKINKNHYHYYKVLSNEEESTILNETLNN